MITAAISNQDGITDDEKEAIKLGLLYNLLLPYEIPIISPLITGKTFTGQEIDLFWEKDIDPEEKYDPSTPELYKNIGRATNTNPRKVQMLTESALGYVAKGISSVTEYALWDYENYGDKPIYSQNPAQDIMVGMGLSDLKPNLNTKYTEHYYRMRDATSEIYDTLQTKYKKAKEGDAWQKQDFERMKLELGDSEFKTFEKDIKGLNKYFNQTDKGLKAVRSEVLAIQRNKDLDGREKGRQIDVLWQERDEKLAQDYLKAQERLIELGDTWDKIY
jgi:hypothetical protein